MTLSSRALSPFVKLILGSICRVDAEELGRIPEKGPLILVMNHINFLEVPLIYTFLHPRGIVGIVKKETWDNPVLGFLARSWEAIPIDRTESDINAMRSALAALAARRIVILAPEGTRSRNGVLGKGHGGVIPIAARSGAAIIPVAHFGGESFWANLRKPRRTRVTFRVGPAFKVAPPEGGFTKTSRRDASEELMRRIARLLPEKYRGPYAGGLDRPDRYLVDLPDRTGDGSQGMARPPAAD